MLTTVYKATLKHKSMLLPLRAQTFARYFNRAATQDNTFKYDMSAYKYRPELIYKIDPAPQYPDSPLPKPDSLLHQETQQKKHMESYRDASIKKSRMAEKSLVGRLFAHHRHEELKQAVQ